MKYKDIREAVFIERPNRFIARVLLGGCEETVHVKNTGRCREILVPGTSVILEHSKNPDRKTKHSLIAAYKGDKLINIDSQAPNTVVFEALAKGQISEIGKVMFAKREVTFKDSRFDLYYENEGVKGFIEVKGATLEEDGVAMFPDAPTERGTKHVYEMVRAVENGYKGNILFLIQLQGVRYFTPNDRMDPEFAQALKYCSTKGVGILAYDSIVYKDEIILNKRISVLL